MSDVSKKVRDSFVIRNYEFGQKLEKPVLIYCLRLCIYVALSWINIFEIAIDTNCIGSMR